MESNRISLNKKTITKILTEYVSSTLKIPMEKIITARLDYSDRFEVEFNIFDENVTDQEGTE